MIIDGSRMDQCVMNYNILLITNQKYFNLSKLCIHSILKNCNSSKINTIYIADIGLESEAREYFEIVSPKISIINTEKSIPHSENHHTKEWIEAVCMKTTILHELIQNNALPLVMMDTDMFVAKDFSHVIDPSKTLQICKRSIPALRPDMTMNFIGSFLVVNDTSASDFIRKWIERIRERIAMNAVPAYETPALCETIELFKDKIEIGYLDEDEISCNNSYIEGKTCVIHMKSDSTPENKDLVTGRINSVRNYRHEDIIKHITFNSISRNYFRQNIKGVRKYICINNTGFISEQKHMCFNFHCEFLSIDKISSLKNIAIRADDPLLIHIRIDDASARFHRELAKLVKKVKDLRLVIEMTHSSQTVSLEKTLSRLHSIGMDVYCFNDSRDSVNKIENDKIHDFLSSYANDNIILYCTKKESSFSCVYFIHSCLYGGAERSAIDAIKNLIAKYGAVVTVVVPAGGSVIGHYTEAGIPSIIIEYAWWTNNVTHNSLLESFKNVYAHKHIIEEMNFDLISTQTMVIPWGALMAAALNKPHIWNIREYGEKDHGFRFILPFPRILEIIKSFSGYITTCGKNLKENLFPDLDSDRVGIAYSRIEIEPAVNNTPQIPRKITFILPGNIVESKGQMEAVTAMTELVTKRNRDNIILLIIGNIDELYLMKINKLIKKHRMENYIIIQSFIPDITQYYQASHIVLSCSRMEAFGRVLVEGLLLCKPVIASDTGGNTEIIIDGKTGLLYRQGDPVDLADKMEYFLNNPEEIDRMGHYGPASVRKKMSGHYAEDTLYAASMRVKAITPAYDSAMVLDIVWQLMDRFKSTPGRFERFRESLGDTYLKVSGKVITVIKFSLRKTGMIYPARWLLNLYRRIRRYYLIKKIRL